MERTRIEEAEMVKGEKLGQMIEAFSALGAQVGKQVFLLSDEFDEEACDHCRELGWTSPE